MRYCIGKSALFSLCFLFAGLVFTGPALTQAIDLNKINKIPRYSTMTPEEFVSKTKLFTEVPQGDKFLEYSIRLPEGWQRLGLNEEERAAVIDEDLDKSAPSNPHDISNLRDQQILEEKNNVSREFMEDSEMMLMGENKDETMVSPRYKKSSKGKRDNEKISSDNASLLGPVAKYIGPANLLASARLEIFAMQLKHDITTRNWFLNFIISHNYTLLGMEQINDNRVDAEYVLLEKGISYIVRTAAISNGSRMVLVSYYVPEQLWEKQKAFQEMSVDSFKFLQPDIAQINDKRTHGFLDLVRFDYPAAWKLIAPNVYSIENMTAKLIYSMDAKTLDGEIDINLISTELDTNLMKEVEYLRQDLKKKGLDIGEALDTNNTYKFDERITFSRVEAYAVSGDKKEYIDYEFWLAIMVEDRYYYIVTMLTPGRQANFYTWARNTESFGGIIQSMVPQIAGETLDSAFKYKSTKMDSGGASLPP